MFATNVALFLAIIVGQASSQTVTISPTPPSPPTAAATLPEDTSGITLVYDVDATTTSTGTVFFLATISPADGKFTFDYATGILSTIADPNFNFEAEPIYTVEVQAHTGDASSTVVTFEVHIEDVNEKPRITNLPASVHITENEGANTCIFDMITTDPDIGALLTYSAVVTPPGTGYKFEFNLPGLEDKVCIIGPPRGSPNIDYEEYQNYNLSITVSDGVHESTPLYLHVEVRNLNEPPLFTDLAATATIYEEAPIGTTLVTSISGIRALDPDILDNDTVTYIMEGKYADYFDIHTIEGAAVITLAKRIDRENMFEPVDGTFILYISAVDRKKLRQVKAKTFELTVTILDVNDHPTICSPTVYQGSITENSPIDTSILVVSCTDSDDTTTNPIKYSVNTTGDPTKYFYFPPSPDNQLSAKYPINLESGSFLTFIVDVAQGGLMNSSTTTVSVEVSVVGANTKRPVMSQTFYNFEFRYDVAVGSQVGAVSATDADVTTAVLTYDWVYAVTEFYMETSNGIITTKQGFTADQKFVYYSQAKDNDVPPDISITSPVRFDTFDPTLYLVDFEVTQPVAYFTEEKKQEFEDAISSACPPCFGRISSLQATPGNPSTTTLTVYALTDSSTELYTNVGMTKTYIPKATMLDVFAIDSAGTPSPAVALPGFFNFPVVKVTPTQFGLTFLEWLLYTPEGNATLALTILACVIAMIATLIYIWRSGAFTRLFRLCMSCNMSDMCKDCCKPPEREERIQLRPPSVGGDFNVFEFRYKDKPLAPKT